MPKILKILTNPDPILRNMSVDVDLKIIATQEFKQLVEDMKKTMVEKDGVGLAAPQVGQNIRLIVVNTERGPLCLINPRLTKKSFAKEVAEEGCFSLPNLFGEVKRHKKVTCKFITENNKQGVIEASGLIARGLQHEIDHLDGILFIDRLEPGAKLIKEKK
ncbi:peptide deformylase [Candidatus Falkowbacteria bacterium]|nr:peptide deformylase [Candidatus Falkowbacteria bacterium]